MAMTCKGIAGATAGCNAASCEDGAVGAEAAATAVAALAAAIGAVTGAEETLVPAATGAVVATVAV
ncbi:MAG TPA: protease modulator HflK, partial [Burkholderiaceae bacterium]